jgi:hypothetical protein
MTAVMTLEIYSTSDTIPKWMIIISNQLGFIKYKIISMFQLSEKKRFKKHITPPRPRNSEMKIPTLNDFHTIGGSKVSTSRAMREMHDIVLVSIKRFRLTMIFVN